MDKLENINTVFFDFDGTLHCVLDAYYNILNDILINENLSNKNITKEDARKYLGYSPVEMWQDFMPNLEKEIQEELIKKVGNKLENNIKNGKSKLYDGSIEVLEELKKSNIELVFISNCMEEYKNNAIKRFNLNKYISRFYSSEEFNFIPKEEILKKIINNYKGDYVFVGDRYHDIVAANKNNIKSVFCTYGYGEISESEGANYKIDRIDRLLEII